MPQLPFEGLLIAWRHQQLPSVLGKTSGLDGDSRITLVGSDALGRLTVAIGESSWFQQKLQ